MRCGRSSTARPRGITLVETVAGTALLGTLFVSLLLANAELTRLAHRAEGRRSACRIADEMLARWWTKPEELPRAGEGAVANQDGWRWRTGVVNERRDELKDVIEIVRLELFGPQSEPGEPAVMVEIALPIMERIDDESTE